MKRSKVQKKIEMSPAVVKAMQGFRPIFGLSEDINIIRKYDAIVLLLDKVDSVEMRKLVREGKKLTSKMQEIRQMEKTLLALVKERNIL